MKAVVARNIFFASLLVAFQSLLVACFSPVHHRRASGAYQGIGATSSVRPTQTRLFLQNLQELEDQYLESAVANTGSSPDVVYIIMYNPGTEQEGVHTTEYPKDGSDTQVILGFEMMADCLQFATALRDNPDFPLEPVTTPAAYAQIQASLEGMGMKLMVVPQLG